MLEIASKSIPTQIATVPTPVDEGQAALRTRLDTKTLAEYPPVDIELAKIGDLLTSDPSVFLKKD
jgi:hypothetical protein